MNTKFTLTPLAAAFLAALALPAHADQIYKWRDAQGQLNYSNVPTRAEARIATPVENQISVINPIDIKPAARASAVRNYGGAMAVQPVVVQPVVRDDRDLQPYVVYGYSGGGAEGSAYSQRLKDNYERSLLPAPDAQPRANPPSQAANLQRDQAAATAQAQSANNPQNSATAREAARVNGERTAAIRAGNTSSGTIGGR